MSNPTGIDIACASDDKYLPHCAVMLQSLRDKNPTTKFTLHFMHGSGLQSRGKRKLARHLRRLKIEVRWVVIEDKQVNQLPTLGYLSQVVWYRILMPELLPSLNKVLFLDCDLIINDDISALWNTSLETQFFAAVTNIGEEKFAHRPQQLGLAGPQEYFNAGVGLWNLKIMREEGFTEAIINYARANASQLLWLEQDAMNALFSSRRIPLHPRWNVQNGMIYNAWGCKLLDSDELSSALEKPGIFHFEGGEAGKPWHFLCTHPHKHLYYKYRRQTPWPVTIPDGLSAKTLIKTITPAIILGWLKSIKRGVKKAY